MLKFVLGDYQVNTYLIAQGQDAYLIDPGFNLISILEEINKYNILGILLTHAHLDHIDGIRYFNVPIYLHESEVAVFKNKLYNGYASHNMKMPFEYANLIIKTLKNNDKINFGSEAITVIHTPGHTLGSVCYLYKNKLFSGDTLFEGDVGRWDFPTGSQIDLQNSVVNLIDSLDENIKIYPGHDIESTIKIERKYNAYYLKWKNKKL